MYKKERILTNLLTSPFYFLKISDICNSIFLKSPVDDFYSPQNPYNPQENIRPRINPSISRQGIGTPSFTEYRLKLPTRTEPSPIKTSPRRENINTLKEGD